MSQIVILKRKIAKKELSAALDQIENLSFGAEHSWGFTIENESDPSSFIKFSSGVLEATSPSSEVFQQLESLASLLGAEIVLEDEAPTARAGSIEPNGREIVLFWPVLVLLLLLLLVWRW